MTSFEDRESKLLGSDDEEQQLEHHANSIPDTSTYYMRLGVSKQATQKEIRRAFLGLSQHYHTDKYMIQPQDVQNIMNTRFQELQEAYSVLSDIKKRAAYDAAGLRGQDRLALVPESWTSREDIISYIRSLDREVELLRTSKMLSATSNIIISYSIAHLFSPLSPFSLFRPSSCPTLAPPLSPFVAPISNDASDGSNTTSLHKEGGTIDTSMATSTHTAASSQPSNEKEGFAGEMTALEVEIDGQRQIVLIPSQKLQDRFREKMQSHPASTSGNDAASSATVHNLAPRRLYAVEAFVLSTLPRSMVFQHSFEHALSPNLNFLVRTEAFAQGKTAKLTMGTYAEYRKSFVTTFAAHVQARMSGLKISLLNQRILSPLWTLQSKLTLLDGMRLLQKLQLSLTRRFSSTTMLENSIMWCLSESGFLHSTLLRTLENGQQSLAMHVGLNTLNFSASTRSEVDFGGRGYDPAYPPAQGRVQYRVSTSAFSGETTMGFEVWYYHERLKHYGLSFETKIPYAPSPFVFYPSFLTSSQHRMTNQLSLLYQRGRHSISIPIVIMISPTISHSIMWCSVPLFFYRLGKLLYRPYHNAKNAKRLAKLREEHIVEIELAYMKALAEQQALEWAVTQIRTQESIQDGLVIINAQYGVLKQDRTISSPTTLSSPSFAAKGRSWVSGIVSKILCCSAVPRFSWLTFLRAAPPGPAAAAEAKAKATTMAATAAGDQAGFVSLDLLDPADEVVISSTLDVTVALQSMVRDSALLLPAGPKSKLVGFCDPDPYALEPKQLKIAYWFHGRKHRVVLGEEDPVELPQREHLVL